MVGLHVHAGIKANYFSSAIRLNYSFDVHILPIKVEGLIFLSMTSFYYSDVYIMFQFP